ncbi:glycosyltransferase family 2 protein [Streptacidiphilus sp. N1-3]|uniref:4,4'-diaponeurosporenoate glycosyltransferase n=1 Tax=Streptacidiphilus alkalitolerans TaxID=3342712 RepID=A0ABV6X674_9ACTN
MIRALAVVVPARDEERLIGSCLRAVHRAARHPQLAGLAVTAVVVADTCADGTETLARALGARTVQVVGAGAGASRALGTAYALDLLRAETPGLSAEEVWLAHTDADTQVPPCWLAHQLRHAAAGFAGILGTVRVGDWSAHPPGTADRFLRQYTAYRAQGREHPHVHGANLGLRADAYLAADGFPPLAEGEDVALVAALERGGHRLLRSDACPVLTSGRRDARARGGFGDLLLTLEPGRIAPVLGRT